MREFKSGAKRDADLDKPDYANALSPLVIKRYGQYKIAHRKLPDGTVRRDNDWKKGIPRDSYMSSLWRHLEDLWLIHEGYPEEARSTKEEALCAILFNASGYLHEELLNEARNEANQPGRGTEG